MADPINDIVSVDITAATVNPTRLGFGTPMVYTYHTRFPELTRRYADVSDMLADGFLPTDEAYDIVGQLKDQNPSVPLFVVGRKASAPSFTTALTITSNVQGQHVQFKVLEPVTGVIDQVDYTIGASATTTTVATAVELLVEALSGVDSTSAAAVVTITPTVAGHKVHVYDLVNCTAEETTADAGYDDEIAALQLEDDDWYFTVIDSASAANVEAMAAWAESSERPKMFFAQLSGTTQTSTALDHTTAIGTSLKTSGYTRTASIFAFDSTKHVDAEWVGMGAPETPGSITWHNQVLIGGGAANLTTTQNNALKAANINRFIIVRGQNVTQGGIVASGEYIDVIHGIDALKADIQESVLAVLIGRNKVPFTKAGFSVIEGAIKGALKRFEPANADDGGSLLAFGTSVVKMPDINLVSQQDKANRALRNVKFTATLAGAIHSVKIMGTLSL